jgi:uncharacterized Zn-finger protein
MAITMKTLQDARDATLRALTTLPNHCLVHPEVWLNQGPYGVWAICPLCRHRAAVSYLMSAPMTQELAETILTVLDQQFGIR